MILSVPFLLATFLVYACIPELHSPTLGKNLMFYVLCLGIGYSIFAGLQLNNGAHITDIPCRFIAFTIYLAFLSSFLWLSAISFEIWWTFG